MTTIYNIYKRLTCNLNNEISIKAEALTKSQNNSTSYYSFLDRVRAYAFTSWMAFLVVLLGIAGSISGVGIISTNTSYMLGFGIAALSFCLFAMYKIGTLSKSAAIAARSAGFVDGLNSALESVRVSRYSLSKAYEVRNPTIKYMGLYSERGGRYIEDIDRAYDNVAAGGHPQVLRVTFDANGHLVYAEVGTLKLVDEDGEEFVVWNSIY